MQEAAGMSAITDGEFRRGSWFLGFVEAVDGLTVAPSPFGFSGDHAGWQCPHCDGRLKRAKGITTGELGFLQGITRRTPKVTMPSPTAMHFWCGRAGVSADAYPDLDDYFEDLAALYREELADLAALGATYVQLDEVPISMLCDPAVRDLVRQSGEEPEALIERYVALINAALEGRPEALTVGLHLCRGNYKGQWMAEGGYDPVAERLFEGIEVDAFFLEYDSARAGDFAPLTRMPGDKHVVLGLVTSKSGALERPDDLKRRIDEAAQFVPLERLSLSPQCGFASSVGGNPLSADDQRRKLDLVAQVADEVWG
jgi:5-methyltetrahydropteroyltriglutamate--homocysteine methyltransferase